MEDKKIIFSGVQPSGTLTFGNYLGAIKNWVELQKDYRCIYAMMDLHTITVRQTPADIRRRTLEVLALYIACGIDPEENILFIQSHNPAHAELSWVLGCYTYMGELQRMTQFKDKSSRHAENINAGLFTYPVLMAADILLYQADYVPVGKDQMQHIEICRDIAQRFNAIYGDVFKIPEGMLPKAGANIKSLQDPTKKMSKSDSNPKAYISMTDHPDVIVKKIKSAVTDSEGIIEYREDDETKAGINNLITIMSAVTKRNTDDIVADYSGKGYGDFKNDVAEAVVENIRPIQEEYDKLIADKAYLMNVCSKGADAAKRISQRTLKKVYKKVGFMVE
ncbi:MAG: tryptophan--tRNA ligase [Oscillospiraceae bacterium]|nr:tryptophan--tRNA ligase [Oscillospiraceae bacterium]